MQMRDPSYRYETQPAMNPESVLQGEHYRITVLTPGLFRLEYSAQGRFTDLASQMAIHRYFPKPEFRVVESDNLLEIYTGRLYLRYNKQPFSPNGLRIEVVSNLSNYDNVWHYGDALRDLRGTARTLDKVDGACPLEPGINSRFGFSVLDDSETPRIGPEGEILPRPEGGQDLYFFGYGHDYLECLHTFYELCGKTPMVPRYVLGNWWSRYYEYTEQSFCELMERFEQEQVPFAVAVIDMDWHLVNIDPKYGPGWTGYTWNRELFPDPERFLAWLHARGMKVTLNLHPAGGVRAYEECYPAFAEYMGVDQQAEEPIFFNITDGKFLEGYFRFAHEPLERQGVDFWWIDWQQGKQSDVPGMDPLWMLNHFHFLHSAKDGKRPMIFSRYGGPGSHRYPIGFSGDTLTTWESLDFQPYFNANAANIGFGWWSNDIGGHMQGVKDDVMATRWLQLGVFSPINRLHTGKMRFYGREPWRYGMEARAVMDEFLRLRHRLMPYLYTMNYRAYAQDRPLVLPLYFFHPDRAEAYEAKNEYYFGTELLVAPITSPNLPHINRGKVSVWLPEGTYIDCFTGLIYQGGRVMDMYRDLHSIPVLAKAGAIVPTCDQIFGPEFLENPQALTLMIFAGADGAFTLYEDDGETTGYEQGLWAKTPYGLQWQGEETGFTIGAGEGAKALIPASRRYTLEFRGLREPRPVVWETNGESRPLEWTWDSQRQCQTVVLPEVRAEEGARLVFQGRLELGENQVEERIFDFLNLAEIGYEEKERIFTLVAGQKNRAVCLNQLQSMDLDRDLEKALTELLTAL